MMGTPRYTHRYRKGNIIEFTGGEYDDYSILDVRVIKGFELSKMIDEYLTRPFLLNKESPASEEYQKRQWIAPGSFPHWLVQIGRVEVVCRNEECIDYYGRFYDHYLKDH